MKLVAQFRSID